MLAMLNFIFLIKCIKCIFFAFIMYYNLGTMKLEKEFLICNILEILKNESNMQCFFEKNKEFNCCKFRIGF